MTVNWIWIKGKPFTDWFAHNAQGREPGHYTSVEMTYVMQYRRERTDTWHLR